MKELQELRNFDVNTVLHTKDGRKIGNAIIVGKDDKYNIIKTDYGNECKFTNGEIEECFYIGYSDLTDEVIQLMTHMFELDIDNCTMTHSQWIAEVAEALTDKNYLSDLVKEYREYLSDREIEFNFKHLK
tara:strand:+ start:511 stop:900 length:390 start_codon:yes stop_codon:yes gene_type:complete